MEKRGGVPALNEKIALWASIVQEIHGLEVSDALVAGNFSSCSMTFDLTIKDVGRNKGHEICVYEVNDGKIVGEHFFYTP